MTSFPWNKNAHCNGCRLPQKPVFTDICYSRSRCGSGFMRCFCVGYLCAGSAAAAVLSSLPARALVPRLRQHARRAASAFRRYYRLSSLQYHACGAYNHCRLILDGAYIFRLRKASAPLSAKACLQLYTAVRHAGLLCAAQFYTRNASFMNFCAFAAFSYLFLFSALLPSAGRLLFFRAVSV